ncbi:LysR family transcriptional regulator [Roseomonas terrae]|jgi:LysR family nitrogen assimilation transcriptional regulator|uniref:LysR family transcriptional regulator n=1 Tax=Neoroseomonas terrae TaxID=424799 RepID=A0ABS5EBL7_9PROT|nr:LysR family transcriptional regulator [Neoroseomonas terrae]MBR0648350.1 LysR family transcriptional regulator [Neoroseomonas terrae]
MQLHQLRYFVHVAELGSFSRAASRLNVTQPALSRQVSLLEQELGVRLLHRDGRGVSLTGSGATLLEHATDLLDRIRDARQAVAASDAVIEGSVRIGLPPGLAPTLLPQTLLRSRRDHPRLAIVTVEATEGAILEEWLLAGRIDMALLDAPKPASRRIQSGPLLRQGLCLVGRTGHETGLLRALATMPLILPPATSPVRQAVEAVARAAALTLNIAWEIDSDLMAKQMLLRDAGVAFLPRDAVAAEVAAGLLWAQELTAPRIEREWIVAAAKERPLSPGGQAVKAALLAEAQLLGTRAPPPRMVAGGGVVTPFPVLGGAATRRGAAAQPAT